MGRDFEAYRPRPVVAVDRELGNTFGAPSPLIELPVSWFLDDFPALENLPAQPGDGLRPTRCSRGGRTTSTSPTSGCPAACSCLTVHPQTIARAHAFMMFERFVDYVAGHDGVWLTTLSEIAAAYRDE